MAETGRPQIELSDLPKGWKETMIELASEGASIVELAASVDLYRSTFYEISKREPEFSDTIKKCKALSEVWWQKQGRSNLQNKDFSYTGWYMNMKNRFGWKDKQDFTTNGKDLPTPILGGIAKSVPTDDSD